MTLHTPAPYARRARRFRLAGFLATAALAAATVGLGVWQLNMAERLAAQERRAQALQAELAGLHQAIERAGTEATTHAGDVRALQARLQAADGRLEQLQSRLDAPPRPKPLVRPAAAPAPKPARERRTLLVFVPVR